MAAQLPEQPAKAAEGEETLGRAVMQASLRVLMFVGLAIVILAGGGFAYRMMGWYSELRTTGLAGIIVAGVGATLCLSGAMYALDIPMTGRCPPWDVRVCLKIGKRVFAVSQVVTMGVALYAATILIFGLKIPGL